jgi:hypothetical protein
MVLHMDYSLYAAHTASHIITDERERRIPCLSPELP